MELTVHQHIVIHNLRVEAITNSSVLQIGSAGIIKALSNVYNTGGFTGAPQQIEQAVSSEISLVPLAAPRRLDLL